LYLKRNGRFFLYILLGIFVITGAYITHNNRPHLKSNYAVEAATGLGNYTVKEGDSIFEIAGKFGVSISALKHTNGLDSEKITPGEVLTIPNEPSGDWYTVENGDTLYSIANKYVVTVDTLKKINGLNSEIILPDQVLIIPPAKMVAAENAEKTEKKETGIERAAATIDNPAPKIQQASAVDSNLPLSEVLRERGFQGSNLNLVILVDKSVHSLSIYTGNTRLKSYPIEIGDGGMGDKEIQGDHKTPEGDFYVAEKSILYPADKFLGTRWLRISYPNPEDAERGLRQGLIDQNTYNQIVGASHNKETPPQYTPLGGGVGIHGGGTKELGSNWTWGCVGLRNQDIEDFFDFVKVGTPIYIQQ
jgi:LysM repeat protein